MQLYARVGKARLAVGCPDCCRCELFSPVERIVVAEKLEGIAFLCYSVLARSLLSRPSHSTIKRQQQSIVPLCPAECALPVIT